MKYLAGFFLFLFLLPTAQGAAADVFGLHALSNLADTSSVKEMTDNELAAVEGGDAAIVTQLEPGFITVSTSGGTINSMGQFDLPHPVFPVGDQAFVLQESCGTGCSNLTVVRPGGTTYLNVTNIH